MILEKIFHTCNEFTKGRGCVEVAFSFGEGRNEAKNNEEEK